MDISNDEWTENELRAAVRDYFTWLQAELRGRSSAHHDHSRHASRASGWDSAALERKYRQIAGVLVDQGLPYLMAHAPLYDYRASLVGAVRHYLVNHPHLFELMEGAVFRPVRTMPAMEDLDPWTVLSEAPEASAPSVQTATRHPALGPLSDDERHHLTEVLGETFVRMLERRRLQALEVLDSAGGGFGLDGLGTEPLAGIDYLAKEQRNRSLAIAGETFVLTFERCRLRAEGTPTYAEYIEHVAAEHGEAAGYDILSYDADGRERYIKVKTTRYRKETPFDLTSHELAMSRAFGDRYWVYRVFEFRTRPMLYTINGPITERFHLTPNEYRARL